MSRKTALVVCPGRGTYNKDELGYLERYHSDKKELIQSIDDYRKSKDQKTVSELDSAERFILAEHSRGDNASPLIYACAYADFLSINQDEYEIAAITGNSMGWYIALAAAGAASALNALHILNTTGTMMQQALIGGQLIYSLVDENWQIIEGRREQLKKLIDQTEGLYPSIELGGMLVFGGTDDALSELEEKLTPEGRFPMRLQNHAAFHTPLQEQISDQARAALGDELFSKPEIPMIDGRGKIWTPWSTEKHELWEYTLGHQMFLPYDFTSAIQVGVKEFAPDKIIILGPGSTLGGAVAQSLIGINWLGWQTKEDFINAQEKDPFIIAMGIDEQRKVCEN